MGFLFRRTNNRYDALMMNDSYEKRFNNNNDMEISEIFGTVRSMLMSQTERKFTKFLKQNHINTDQAVLNMIQNSCLLIASKGGIVALIKGSDKSHTIYKEVNSIKLNKGYIDQHQHDENLKVYTCAVSGMPYLGR